MGSGSPARRPRSRRPDPVPGAGRGGSPRRNPRRALRRARRALSGLQTRAIWPRAPDTGPVRTDLTAEASGSTRLLRELLPDDGEVAGLLALMLLTEARSAARISAGGELVTLDEQDRSAWDRTLIAEGHRLVRERLASGKAPGPYQLLAAINAVHTLPAISTRPTGHRSSRSTTNCGSTIADRRAQPGHRGSRVDGRTWPWPPSIGWGRTWPATTPYYATRAELLRRVGRTAEARGAYEQAIELAGNSAEAATLKTAAGPAGWLSRARQDLRGTVPSARMNAIRRPANKEPTR